ncbi:MAG: hypothetical protein GWP91_04620, partial [Rhodobacterales bacterium]|nr:hypothetical protein [Rhodobacterales bacterium]
AGESGSLDDANLRVLEAAGMHSLTAPVDATNLVNLELGQPTHAFDADKLVGPITIRTSIQGETAWPLFTEGRVTLAAGTLVIADDEKILAIAGVIGCEESKTTEATTRLVLESAAFDPVAVRLASRALNTHTDSSARFEKGSDPTLVLVAAGRVATLLKAAGWTQSADATLAGHWTDPERTVSLSVGATAAFLDVPLDATQISQILGRFGFSSEINGDSLYVRVPPHRLWDVAFPQDLYEELAKAIGYNQTPITLPPVSKGAVPSDHELRKRRTEEVLLSNGFYEVFTDGFYGNHMREQLGLTEDDALWKHVQTANALERSYGLLKNNALAQAIECVATNIRQKNPSVLAYEWTRTFHPTGAQTSRTVSPCTERKLLWAVSNGGLASSWAGRGRGADVWFMKGLVHEIGVELGLQLTVGPVGDSQGISDLLHPGRRAAIYLDGQTVGLVGELHPLIRRNYKLKKNRPCYLEIDADALTQMGETTSFSEPPSWQPLVRSLAFTLPPGFEAGRVVQLAEQQQMADLMSMSIIDLFAHNEDGVDLRTVTYELSFANPTSDQTSAAVNEACEALTRSVEQTFGGEGVKLR